MSTTIPAKLVKELRDKTGAGMMDCKKALEEAGGDIDAATTSLRTKGAADAAKRAGREAREGIVDSYIHTGGRVGVLVEVNCETDFVARTEDFQHVRARPGAPHRGHEAAFVCTADVPEEYKGRERAVYVAQSEDVDEQFRDKAVEGKLAKHLEGDRAARPGVRPRPGGEEAADDRAAPRGGRLAARRERHHPAVRSV